MLRCVVMSRTQEATSTRAGSQPTAGVWPYVVPAALLLSWHREGRLKRMLQRSKDALHETREQLDAVTSVAPVGIVQTDLGGRILLANDCYCGLVGHRPAHLRTLKMHELTHPEDRATHLEQHAAMLATGQPFRIENRLLRSDESEVWVISHLTVTRNASGRPTQVIAAVQDISHLRSAKAALQALLATLDRRVAEMVAKRVARQESIWQSQRMEALGQLAGGVAHDFNNVLQAVASGARLIQRQPNNAAAVERLAGLVLDAAERGATITRHLSSFAHRSPLQPGRIDAAALLNDMRDRLASTIGDGISIQLGLPNISPQLLADRGQLETVLVSLATNARDAMASDGSAGDAHNTAHVLTLTAAVVDGSTVGLAATPYVRIEVTDTGPGMSAEVLEHAAEPFFSTKARGQGIGLGLAMAHGFAGQSGGKLVLSSQAGQGVTASLFLPQAGAPAGQVTDGANPAEARKPRIILIDDDLEVLEILGEVLISCGYDVASFDDAAAALSHLNSEKSADLLITDLSMPGTDGLALIREAQRRHPGLPAILLTGYSGEELGLTTGRLAGGQLALLQKPVRAAELTKRVAAMLSDTLFSPT